jgi:predicted NUDIX family NTP pyrophosphohydrolase
VVTRSKKKSAGILVYRKTERGLEVLLAHPGGPIFRNRDLAAWTIPKGEIEPNELPLDAARRELLEETSFSIPGPFLELGTVKLKSGKIIHAWAGEGDLDLTTFRSARFQMEWPPRSGRTAEFPELDQVRYFDLETARTKLNEAQSLLIDRLRERLAKDG